MWVFMGGGLFKYDDKLDFFIIYFLLGKNNVFYIMC